MAARPMTAEEKRATKERIALHDAYAAVFSGPNAAAVLADLERRGFVHDAQFSAEPGRMQFNEGRRSIVLHIKLMMSQQARESLITALQPELSEGVIENA